MTDTYCFQGDTKVDRNNEVLQDAFRSVGDQYGFNDIEAAFANFKEFKSTWQRAGLKANFQISDYLMGAQSPILEDFAGSLFQRIARRKVGEIYTDKLRAWLVSPQFLASNQPTYLARSRNLSRSTQGEAYDLKDTLASLREQDLVHDCDGAVLNWTLKGNRMRVGYCSVLMKVVAISSMLDSEKVPSFVHEYVLYHELLHIENGLDPGLRHHGPLFRQKERLYPRWKESEEWLKKLACRRAPFEQ
jgi:hypothetical protein